MLYHVVLSEDGRILSSSTNCNLYGSVDMDMPENFNCENQNEWQLNENGLWIRNIIPVQSTPLTDIEKIKIRLDANESAVMGIMDLVLGGMM